MSLATWAALPTSVWMRMYAVTTGTHLLCVLPPAAPCRDWCRGDGGMRRLVRRARGRTVVLPTATARWLLGGPAHDAQDPAARISWTLPPGRNPGRQAAPVRPSRPVG